MRRHRPAGKKIYTIAQLLEKQPGAFKRGTYYSLLTDYVYNSQELYSLRFNKRCYSLLHNGIIKPEHLENFYRTYKLPKHPFFPLFLSEKRTYFRNQEEKKRAGKLYIDQNYKRLPLHIKDFFNRLAELEIMYNSSGKTPLYNLSLYPKTKKKIDAYSRFSHEEWIECFEFFLKKLQKRYERVPQERRERLLACFILLSIPSSLYSLPNESALSKNYRILSMKYHPDKGGNPNVFIKIKWAREVLSSQ